MSNTPDSASAASSSKPLVSIADVQGYDDTRRINIDKVGIKDIKHPVRVKDRTGGEQHTVATFSMLVYLPHNYKGTHMSRFVEILNRREKEITVETFQLMLPEMVKRLNSEKGVIEMRFPYFVNKQAPVSKVESLMDYDVTFIGEHCNGTTEMTLKVIVPVTSLCPCSKEISAYGAHNQRSHITVTALLAPSPSFVWIEDIVDLVESIASCELWALLKRPDEKWVTERAYENPKFVEDMVRDAAHLLNKDDRIVKYTIESENFESIHNHSAYALIENDKRTKS
jgi:GTP cyclohydrolase I